MHSKNVDPKGKGPEGGKNVLPRDIVAVMERARFKIQDSLFLHYLYH